MSNKTKNWEKHTNRLRDALDSNAHDNQLESMIRNLSKIPSSYTQENIKSLRERLLYMSLKNSSKECAIYLISIGSTVAIRNVIMDCKYNKIKYVYNLINELDINTDDNTIKTIITQRLVDYSKLDINNHRVDILMDLISESILEHDDVNLIIKELYKDKPEKMGHLISFKRDFILKELGIAD